MKYKSLSLLIIVLFSACTIGAQNRKKVGIVLSGGGAKGVAHIGALKVIEEAGIPIDYVRKVLCNAPCGYVPTGQA